jgi:hypothetical protein
MTTEEINQKFDNLVQRTQERLDEYDQAYKRLTELRVKRAQWQWFSYGAATVTLINWLIWLAF